MEYNYIQFTLENYHQPDWHFVKESEKDNPLVIEHVQKKAMFDGAAQERLNRNYNQPANAIFKEDFFLQYAYIYSPRAGGFKYGMRPDGTIEFFRYNDETGLYSVG
jgi:hypothetical protein